MLGPRRAFIRSGSVTAVATVGVGPGVGELSASAATLSGVDAATSSTSAVTSTGSAFFAPGSRLGSSLTARLPETAAVSEMAAPTAGASVVSSSVALPRSEAAAFFNTADTPVTSPSIPLSALGGWRERRQQPHRLRTTRGRGRRVFLLHTQKLRRDPRWAIDAHAVSTDPPPLAVRVGLQHLYFGPGSSLAITSYVASGPLRTFSRVSSVVTIPMLPALWAIRPRRNTHTHVQACRAKKDAHNQNEAQRKLAGARHLLRCSLLNKSVRYWGTRWLNHVRTTTALTRKRWGDQRIAPT